MVVLTQSELADLLDSVLRDYETLSPPFDENLLPEKKVIRDIDIEEDRALFLTLTAAVDYRKETEGESGLWRTAKRFWETRHWVYEPESLIEERRYHELIDEFETSNIMGWKDSHIWYRNCLTLYRKFNSNPIHLLSENNNDALQILKYMRNNGRDFPYLKGKKISSLWLRLMHEEIRELHNMQEIAIPVDVRIRSMTEKLLCAEYSGTEIDDRDIRQFWREFCMEYEFIPVRLDQPLWLMDKYWADWGEKYVERKSTEVR